MIVATFLYNWICCLEKSRSMQKHRSFVCVKTCSRVHIHIYLSSIKTLDQKLREEIEIPIGTNLDWLRCAVEPVEVRGFQLVKLLSSSSPFLEFLSLSNVLNLICFDPRIHSTLIN